MRRRSERGSENPFGGFSKNEELRDAADQLVEKCSLPALLAGYSSWFIGGSYNYELMCWRDLDVYVLDPSLNLRKCFEIAYELTRSLSATKSRFTNNVGSDPNGLYWGIKLGDERQGAWKIDLWFLDAAGYEKHSKYCDDLRLRLTPETRLAILEIKEAYWQRREYRDTVSSDLIYRAVLDHDVRTVHDFEKFLEIAERSQ